MKSTKKRSAHPIGGSYAITIGGKTTAPIAHDAPLDVVEREIRKVRKVRPGPFVVR